MCSMEGFMKGSTGFILREKRSQWVIASRVTWSD